MSKFVATVLVLLLATATSSQIPTTEWAAHFNDWACYVMRSAGPLKVGSVNRVKVVITFYTPRNVDEIWQSGRPSISAKPVVLQVQVLPPFPSWHVLKEDRIAVAVVKGESAVPLTPDATAGADARPGFAVGGDAAATVWNELRDGQGMELLIQYAEEQGANLHVASEQVTIAAAMMDSCISESQRAQRR